MTATTELRAELDEFEFTAKGVGAILVGFDEVLHHLNIDQEFIPTGGKYIVSIFTIRLSINDVQEGISPEVGSDKAIVELIAEFQEGKTPDHLDFSVYDESEDQVGVGSIRSDQLPENVGFDGTNYYMTITLHYDEEYTKTRIGWDERDIEDRKKRTRKKFEERFDLKYP